MENRGFSKERRRIGLMSQCCFVADGLALATNVGTAKHLDRSRGIVAVQGGFWRRKIKAFSILVSYETNPS